MNITIYKQLCTRKMFHCSKNNSEYEIYTRPCKTAIMLGVTISRFKLTQENTRLSHISNSFQILSLNLLQSSKVVFFL